MPNPEHLEQLKRGVEHWNQWRNSVETRPDFIYAHFRGINLRGADFSGAIFIESDLSGADLRETILTAIDFSEADLSGADLRGANLNIARLIGTNLSEAKLTGANIKGWQIDSSTSFNGVQCDYIFRSYDYKKNEFTNRLPVDPSSTFKPGEFEQWLAVRQGALDTIDITFTDGIDWQAFFQSLQKVRQQHPEAAVRMQSVQEVNGSYVASLQLETEVEGDALDQLKATIESEVKASYERQLAAAQGEIQALGGKVEGLQWSLEQTLKMGSNNIHQNFYGPTGNVAGTNWGNMTATINNNYGPQADDIIQLLTSLRESAQSFPDEQKSTAQVHIEDLTSDIAQPQPNPARLQARFVALLGVAIALGTHIATATDFANNVLELSQKLDVPAQTLEPQLQQLKQLHPDFQWNPGE